MGDLAAQAVAVYSFQWRTENLYWTAIRFDGDGYVNHPHLSHPTLCHKSGLKLLLQCLFLPQFCKKMPFFFLAFHSCSNHIRPY